MLGARGHTHTDFADEVVLEIQDLQVAACMLDHLDPMGWRVHACVAMIVMSSTHAGARTIEYMHDGSSGWLLPPHEEIIYYVQVVAVDSLLNVLLVQRDLFEGEHLHVIVLRPLA